MKKRKRKFGKRYRGPRGPRKPKSYYEIMELKGKEYEYVHHPTAIGVVMELYEKQEDQMITLEELVQKFYRIHLASCKHDERLNPIMFKLIDERDTAYPEKAWVAIFYGGFHVYINRGRAIEGPHSAQLWFRSHTTKLSWWIATLQLMCFFFNENQIKEELMQCILRKEWFVSSNEANKAIVP